MKIKESDLVKTIRRVFVDFEKVSIRNRQGKKYLTVSIKHGNNGQKYNYILSLRAYLVEHFNKCVRMTSGGVDDATFRIN